MLIRVLRNIDRFIGTFCMYGLMISLFLMISLTVLNVILRQFNTNILWVDPLVRQLVFLSGFLGGAIATAAKQHIAIDVLGRVMEQFKLERFKIWVDRSIYVFCIIALIWMSYAGYLLVDLEQKFGKVEFLGVHSSVLAGIIPFGMIIIAYRFFYLLILSFFPHEKDFAGTSSPVLAREGM
ncbi:MAG: TRAP transporter small permease [Oligoflexus sp.]